MKERNTNDITELDLDYMRSEYRSMRARAARAGVPSDRFDKLVRAAAEQKPYRWCYACYNSAAEVLANVEAK